MRDDSLAGGGGDGAGEGEGVVRGEPGVVVEGQAGAVGGRVDGRRARADAAAAGAAGAAVQAGAAGGAGGAGAAVLQPASSARSSRRAGAAIIFIGLVGWFSISLCFSSRKKDAVLLATYELSK